MIKIEKPEEYQDRLHEVLEVVDLNSSLFLIRIEKRSFSFVPGQFVLIGLPGEGLKREYSIYSGAADPWIDLIIREVPGGDLSGRLRKLVKGDHLILDGPAGDFILPEDVENQKFLFVASGTGVSPFHSMIKSLPGLNYRLLLGYRGAEDEVLTQGLDPEKVIRCSSRDHSGDFIGYVTAYLEQNLPAKDSRVFLCGNGNMVYDGFNILTANGLDRNQLHAEIFF